MSSQLTRKDISRRDFLRLSAAAAGAAVFVGPASALPAFAESGAADEAAINALPATLFDASRCTGCRSCEEACVATHNLNPTAEDDGKLTANRYTYIAEVPLESRPRWVQKQCMHCLEPACVAACTVGALHVTPEGVITIDKDKCFGCRYCQYACPFSVPAYDWTDPFGIIHKCDFCLEKQRAGEQIACVAACPTGALHFGTRAEMLHMAHNRIKANPRYYVDHVYGEFEVGGTRRLYISDVPMSMLGLRDLPHDSVPHKTHVVMSKTPVIAAGVAGIATAVYTLFGRKNEKHTIDVEEHQS
jgi:formate dehydrogenase iron-sulfur subunit